MSRLDSGENRLVLLADETDCDWIDGENSTASKIPSQAPALVIIQGRFREVSPGACPKIFCVRRRTPPDLSGLIFLHRLIDDFRNRLDGAHARYRMAGTPKAGPPPRAA